MTTARARELAAVPLDYAGIPRHMLAHRRTVRLLIFALIAAGAGGVAHRLTRPMFEATAFLEALPKVGFSYQGRIEDTSFFVDPEVLHGLQLSCRDIAARKDFRDALLKKFKQTGLSEDEAVAAVRALDVQPIADSYLISVSVTTDNPAVSVRAANTAAIMLRWSNNRIMIDWASHAATPTGTRSIFPACCAAAVTLFALVLAHRWWS